MKKQKKYFKSPYVKGNEEYLHNEFSEKLPLDGLFAEDKQLSSTATSRRDFLKFLGFSTAAAVLSSCEAPVRKSIPYLNKPEEIIPGNPNFYASSCFEENVFSSLLVKTREGRPISLKSNDKYLFNQGGLNTRTYASVLSLYDSGRLKDVKYKNGNNNLDNPDKLDEKIRQELERVVKKGKQIAIVSSTIISPTTKKVISSFSKKYQNVKVIYCDSISKNGILEANKDCFGERFIPTYKFNKANYIVSFGADFLGEWLDTGHAKQYSEKRNPGKEMSKHYQFESLLSLTGANSDKRVPINPDQQLQYILYLLNKIQGKKLVDIESQDHRALLDDLAKELLDNKGKSIVVSGSNNKDQQIIINAINSELENYGKTINTDVKSNLYSSNNDDLNILIKDAENGKVGAIITSDYNLAYHYPKSRNILDSNQIDLKISISQYLDETASLMDFAIPKSHYLESWGDFNPYSGVYTLQQPTINPIFKTRQIEEILLSWIDEEESYYDYLKKSFTSTNDHNWNDTLRDGVYSLGIKKSPLKYSGASLDQAVSRCEDILKTEKGQSFLCLYSKTSMGSGIQSNNPWLQELPDPISKTTWDNYITISPAYAKELNLKNWNVADGALNGDVVDLSFNEKVYRLPVYIQPGQAYGTLGLAFGYGRTKAGKVGNGIGVNAFELYNNNQLVQKINPENISKVADMEHEFACTQVSHTMMGRQIVKETTLSEYLNDPKAGNQDMKFASYKGDVKPSELNLYEEHTPSMHFWNMAIDLNKCNGCGACIIACHAENNVPVVGKEEIRKNRDMHWLRLDRYYSSDMNKDLAAENNVGAIQMYSEMEEPSAAENLEVVFQPVMCQHCNQAPCENVCPVAATTHSNEGLNQMTYNRCIGTRYCLNNCPYKVRRFNWFNYKDNDNFDYHMNDDLGKMVLNPDVTVRARGVMEKCSMCVQNIQKAKLDAKKEGRKVRDGEVDCACETACDTGAIVFGDILNKSSRVVKEKNDPRSYVLLEEFNTQPSVFYKTKVRNKKV